MLRLMEAAESLSTAEWTLLTDVLLLGPAEPAQQPQEKKKIKIRSCCEPKRLCESIQYILGMVYSVSSASCSVSLSSNLMSLNHDGSECPSSELTLSLSGEGVSENSVL